MFSQQPNDRLSTNPAGEALPGAGAKRSEERAKSGVVREPEGGDEAQGSGRNDTAPRRVACRKWKGETGKGNY